MFFRKTNAFCVLLVDPTSVSEDEIKLEEVDALEKGNKCFEFREKIELFLEPKSKLILALCKCIARNSVEVVTYDSTMRHSKHSSITLQSGNSAFSNVEKFLRCILDPFLWRRRRRRRRRRIHRRRRRASRRRRRFFRRRRVFGK